MTSEPLKVLHVLGGLGSQGGITSFVLRVAAEDHGRIQNILWKHRHFQPIDEPGHYLCLGAVRYTDRNLWSDILGAFRELPSLVRWSRQQKRLIIYAHSRLGIFASVMAGFFVPAPVLIHLHALAGHPGFYRLLWRGAHIRPIFNSAKTCRHYGEDPAHSRIVMPPITWQQPAAQGKGTAIRFVACGAFVRGKHFDILVRAFQKLRQNRPAAELHIYGLSVHPADPAYQNEIVALTQKTPAVHLHKWNAKWTDFLRCDDVFVHLGRPESFGMVILEAFARGCKLVVLEDTFLDDLPPPLNVSGAFRAQDLAPESIAQQMERALLDQAEPGTIWEVRQPAAGLFSIEAARSKLVQVYDEIVPGVA